MADITVRDLTLRFPLIGADSQSLKRYLKQVAIGGSLARNGSSHQKTLTALRQVNLRLGPGDRLGLIGSNGSGKTTLLRCLAGAYAPDEGYVEVNGRVASLLDLSMGIDHSATGLENIRLRGLVAGLTPREIKAKIEGIAEFSGLGPFLAMPIKTYSSGMQARLAFALSIAIEFECYLIDEVIMVGDQRFHARCREQLFDRRADRALVLASHDANFVKEICDAAIVLIGGKAHYYESVEEAVAVYQAL